MAIHEACTTASEGMASPDGARAPSVSTCPSPSWVPSCTSTSVFRNELIFYVLLLAVCIVLRWWIQRVKP